MRARALALGSLLALAGCPRVPMDQASIDARTMHLVAGDLAMHAIAFPPLATVHPAPTPLVVVEPVVFGRALLLRDDGLVPWLEGEGFQVWLVGADSDAPHDERAMAIGVAQSIEAVARATDAKQVDVLALGLGGPPALHALELTRDAPRVRRIAFLGAPLDEAYPHTFDVHSPSLANAFHDPARATRWLGAIPPATAEEKLPARERYPLAATLGDVPVLFVAGKADAIAPSESVFPVFTLWGSRASDPRAVPKVLFLAGRENGFARDDDAFDLVAGDRAPSEVWAHVAAWLND